MNVEAIRTLESSQPQVSKVINGDLKARQNVDDSVSSGKVEKKQVQPEEMLQQIKSLTQDGLYSVRFENDQTVNQLVVKVVDRETDEVIRQIPAEELLFLTQTLEDLRGNIVNTEG